MAYPQGIAFRATAGYVTDAANYDPETDGENDYPRTTAQGNNVGWETVSTSYQPRNRNAGNDPRLAGTAYHGGILVDFRLDLPSAGNYDIGLAAGDASYAKDVDIELFDTSSSLGALTSGSTSGANQFKDATDTEYSAANWVTSQTLATKAFSTTICRFRIGAQPSHIASLWVESGDVVAPTGVYLGPIQSNLRWR